MDQLEAVARFGYLKNNSFQPAMNLHNGKPIEYTITDNVAGNATSNLFGNVTGNITGNLTGNVISKHNILTESVDITC